HAPGVRGDERAPREDAEVDGLEVREEREITLDGHDGLAGSDLVTVIEGVGGQRLPVVGTELEDCDRLVHSTQHCLVLLEDLHDDAGPTPVREQRVAGMIEVGVRVVALPHLLDGEVEDLRWEALPPLLRCGHLQRILEAETGWSLVVDAIARRPGRADDSGAQPVSASSRRTHSSRARFATSSCSGEGSAVTKRCWSSWPGYASARASGFLSF